MSRRAAIEEEFDDDTDLPLPSKPLPNTGSRGPVLEEMHISDDEFGFESQRNPRAGPASPPKQQARADSGQGGNRITDITPYKNWTCIYPIYIDAKRAYAPGQRRIARPKSVWWPLSKDIADAASRLGLGTLHEVNKVHPRDWENPGRVRVQWKREGHPVNPGIKTKKQLLELICLQLQLVKPENVPKPPFFTNSASTGITATGSPKIPAPHAGSSSTAKEKGKQPVFTSSSKSKTSSNRSKLPNKGNRKPPSAPNPEPPISARLSAYSPAISSGVLIETVKAGMNAVESASAGTSGPPTGVPGAGAKGKRKVVRVRG